VEQVIKQKQLNLSLYSPYYAAACNELVAKPISMTYTKATHAA